MINNTVPPIAPPIIPAVLVATAVVVCVSTRTDTCRKYYFKLKQNFEFKRNRDWALLQKVKKQGAVASNSEMI